MGIRKYLRPATGADLDHLVAQPKTLDWFLSTPTIRHVPPDALYPADIQRIDAALSVVPTEEMSALYRRRIDRGSRRYDDRYAIAYYNDLKKVHHLCGRRRPRSFDEPG